MRRPPLDDVTIVAIEQYGAGPFGTLYLADMGNSSIRKLSPAGNVTTVARLADSPYYLALEPGGTLLISAPRAVLRLRP